MLIISDTGPIISLSVIDKLELIDNLFDKVAIPEAVWQELEKHIVSLSIPQVLKYRGRVISVKQPVPIIKGIDPGEAQAICLIEETGADVFLVEDRKARLFAESLGIRCTGSLGILESAKEAGLISCIRPFLLELLLKGRYFSLRLLNKTLADNNEAPI